MISDLDFLLEINDDKPTEPPPELISEYIHGRRILPPGSPCPGPFDIHVMPAMIEPMDCLGPYSGVNRITMMKGVQIMATTYLAENPISYYMDANPAEIMYCSATDALLEKWTKRLEPLIDSCGYRHKIAAQVENTKSRKTGDKMYSKEYAGGSLSMTSLQSPAGMRSESNQILIIDEADGAPAKTTTGEGSYLGVLEGRTAAYGSKYKIAELSTPSTYEESVIYPQFKEGDQRYYNVPCLHCGSMIVFKFEYLKPKINKIGNLESVFYECQKCNQQLFNSDKTEMMKYGEWIATAVSKDPRHRSYQLSSMYSPVGFFSWHRMYDFYLKAEENPDRKPSFVNLYKGLPFKEDGTRPDISKKIRLRGEYKDGTVPRGVLYMTMAADVQRGKEKFQAMSADELASEIARMKRKGMNLWKAELPRIELEVYGVGKHYRSWSIDYKIFYGHTTQGPYEGAFEEMYQWAEESGLEYFRDDGIRFVPKIALMDASDGVTQNAVFEFCDRIGSNCYPNINDGWLKKKKDPGVDEETHRNFDRYRLAKKGKGGPEYVQISTNYYKKIVYQRLKIERELDDSKPQRPAFCDFPIDRADHYFKMLTNEELMNDGSFHNGGRPVESLDIRGYNLCAADVFIEAQVKEMRAKAEKARYSPADIEKFDKKYFLNQLEVGLRGQSNER
jgi:phage terminase large subunit GpA-like protein